MVIVASLILITSILGQQANSQTINYKIKKNNYIKKNGQYYSADSLGNALDRADTTSILVKFNNNVSSNKIDSFAVKHKLQLNKTTPGNWHHFYLKNKNSIAFCNSIQNNQLIRFIRVPVFYKALLNPNDPFYQNNGQWHLNKILTTDTWDITTGGGNAIVAVLDNGVEWSHTDLGNNLFLNSAEDDWQDPNDPTSGNNIDDDKNGYVDDWKWWNTEAKNNNTYNASSMNHGTLTTGIIAAKTNNNIGVAGVSGGWGSSPGIKLMHVKVASGTSTKDLYIADGIEYAVDNGANVISISYGGTEDLDGYIGDAINYAKDNGVVVVASAGNNPKEKDIYYPARHEYVIAVGNTTQFDLRNSTSCYKGPLDISAPGTDIKTTTISNSYGSFTGTSCSCPVVAGVISLMLSQNPCLTPSQIDYILKRTSSAYTSFDSPYNHHPYFNQNGKDIRSFYHDEYGYMIVNAYQAVKVAQNLMKDEDSYDLFIRDHEDDDLWTIKEDFGQEPNPNSTSVPIWDSPDIWVRNQQDPNNQTPVHEDPEYDPNNPVYAYVRIKNNGCQPSSGNDELKLYWAKAGTGLGWPAHWNGSLTNPIMGDMIGSEVIPSIPPGEEVIIEIPWYVPNPDDYAGINPEPWHFCLLARIESTQDPMTFQETNNVYKNTHNNNNIAWKNMEVVDLQSNDNPRAAIAIGSIHEEETSYMLEFNCLQDDSIGNIFNEAEITVRMDDNTWEKWLDGEQIGEGIEVTEEKVVQLIEQDATIGNLVFEPYEFSTITVNFNFLTEKAREYFSYKFNVIQYKQDSDEIIGGETYSVLNYDREEFEADATVTDPEIEEGSSTTVNAISINEPAEYVWKNQYDSIIHNGKDNFTMHPKHNQMIVLEVTALNDGYKDYDTVYVKVKKEFIKQLAPNPATSFVNVKMKLDDSKKYTLELVNSNNTILQTHSVNGNTSDLKLNINNLSPGVYKVSLLSSSGAIDYKKLIIN